MNTLDHMKQYHNSEEARLQCLASAIRIGLIEDNENGKDAHEAGWNAAIVYMAMNDMIKEECDVK